jgi:hypothetical protein
MPRPIWHYFVGDIHGCFDSLRALEDRIAAHAARNDVRPFIVSVGDLIDRGPASRAVVSHFRAGVAAGSHAAVLGNHDVLMLECIEAFGPWPAEIAWPAHLYRRADHHARGQRAARWLSASDHAHYTRMLWISQGGYQSLESYGCDPGRPASWIVDPKDLAFLVGLPTIWQSERFVVSHALAQAEDLARVRAEDPARVREEGPGLDTAVEVVEESATREPISQQSSTNLEALREACHDLIWNRKLPAGRPDPARTHISGHTPMARVRRRPALGIVQIDTGCVYGRRLSAWCGEADAVISVALRDVVDA